MTNLEPLYTAKIPKCVQFAPNLSRQIYSVGTLSCARLPIEATIFSATNVMEFQVAKVTVQTGRVKAVIARR